MNRNVREQMARSLVKLKEYEKQVDIYLSIHLSIHPIVSINVGEK